MTQALTSLPRSERRLLTILASFQLTHIVDFVVMMPLGPMLQRDLDITTDQFSVLVSSYTFAAAIAGLISAGFVDACERKKLLLTFYALFVLATLACAFAPHYGGLLVGRIMAGGFGGVMGVVLNTIVGEQIPADHRGRAGSYLSAAFAISTVAGLPMALWLANHLPSLGWRAPFGLVAVVGLVCGLVAWRWLTITPQALSSKQEGAWQRIRDTLSDPVHLWSLLLLCLVLFSSFSIIPFLTIYAVGTLKFPEVLLPMMYLVGGTCTLLSSRWMGRCTDRLGGHKAFNILAVLAIFPMLIVTHIGPCPPWLYVIINTLFAILVSARMIPTLALSNGSANPALRGTFMGLSATFQSAALGLATLTTGHLVSTNSAGELLNYHYAGYIALVATTLALWVAPKVRQRS
jgi:predicted MFS family arabinose efflux permease